MSYNNNAHTAVYLSIKTISLLKKEFNIPETEVEHFIDSMLNKIIEEHIGETNSKIFSEDETKEIEDDLKGLGYI